MKVSVIIIAVLSLTFVGLSFAIDDETAWIEYKRSYQKRYASRAEEEIRKRHFLENKHYMERHNDAKSELTFTQGINELADLSVDEVNTYLNGFRPPNDEPVVSESGLALILSSLGASLEETRLNEEVFYDENDNSTHRATGHLDWRNQGRVSRVKDQGMCGSCWAFATTGALEGYLASQNRTILLSEQNLVDCSGNYGNNGCNGGLMDAALKYVRDHGIMASREYPYTAKNGPCKFRPSRSVMRSRGSARLPRGNESLLRLALRLSGPLPVAIDASLKSFHLYKSGIYNDNHCKNKLNNLNHAVLLIGYGTDSQGSDYWIIKNSWGRKWGERGFMRIARRNNLCGISSYAVLPIN